MERKRVVIETVDDIDGETEGRRVRFGLDQKIYEIDLCEKNEARLRKALAPFIECAKPVRAKAKKRRGPDPRDVRAWAIENGVEVPATGRVPGAVVEAYLAK